MNNSAVAVAALPYQEPNIATILILSSFLFLLNIINNVLDRLIYCGLIGQVTVGVAFGTPGAKWLHNGTEQIIVQLGYLGLILLIYEGGLSTNIRSLKANAGLSVLVALTGICLPIAFAFCLQSLASTTPLQAFAAGTALCCTSLGTTFTILNTCDLAHTRLGTVLASAAMMDDVVGLIMVQVISRLGSGSSSHLITVPEHRDVNGFNVAFQPNSESVRTGQTFIADTQLVERRSHPANSVGYLNLIFAEAGVTCY